MIKGVKVIILSAIFLLVGCSSGEKVDDEALLNVSQALEKRWEFTGELPEEVSLEDLEKIVQIELDELKVYEADDFKDTSLFVLYDKYRRDLKLIQTYMIGASIDSPNFQDKWRDHMENRSKTLFDLNSNYNLEISDSNKEKFEEVLAGASNLNEAEKIEKGLSDIDALSEIDVVVEKQSASITFLTESTLSAESFVVSKIGFPEKAIEILRIMKDFDYEDIVISTTNQGTIALSSYFTKESLKKINFDKWNDLESLDAYKFYRMTDGYHIRVGIWESLDEDVKRLVGEMNKQNSNEFWKKHGFPH